MPGLTFSASDALVGDLHDRAVVPRPPRVLRRRSACAARAAIGAVGARVRPAPNVGPRLASMPSTFGAPVLNSSTLPRLLLPHSLSLRLHKPRALLFLHLLRLFLRFPSLSSLHHFFAASSLAACPIRVLLSCRCAVAWPSFFWSLPRMCAKLHQVSARHPRDVVGGPADGLRRSSRLPWRRESRLSALSHRADTR